MITAIAGNNGGAGILTHGQQAIGRNHRILQHFQRDKPVILAGFRIIQNGPQLAKMAAAQQMRDICKGTRCQQAQRLWRDFQECLTAEIDQFYMIA